MAKYIAQLPNQFDIASPDLAEEWKYWAESFNNFQIISKISNEEIKIKLFRSAIGRPLLKYLEDQPDSANLTDIKLIFERIRTRLKKKKESLTSARD